MNRDDHVFMRRGEQFGKLQQHNFSTQLNCCEVQEHCFFPLRFIFHLTTTGRNRTFFVVRREARPSEIDQSHAESAALSFTAKATQSPAKETQSLAEQVQRVKL